MYPAWANQAVASAEVMASIARRTASSNASRVRAPRPRRSALRLENACAMGVKSGAYGGRKSREQPRASLAWRMLAALWALKWSRTTTCPGRSLGTRHELLRDLPRAGRAVPRPVDQPGVAHALGGERGDQRGVLAVLRRHRSTRPLGRRRPAVPARQRRLGATFVDKDDLLRVARGDRRPPGGTRLLVALAGCQ